MNQVNFGVGVFISAIRETNLVHVEDSERKSRKGGKKLIFMKVLINFARTI